MSLCRFALLSVLFASPRPGIVEYEFEYEFGTTADFTGMLPIVSLAMELERLTPLLEGKGSLLGDLGP